MVTRATRRIEGGIDSALDARIGKLAEENGRTKADLVNEALQYYLEVVVPRQNAVRPDVLAHFERSLRKNRKLLKLLAG